MAAQVSDWPRHFRLLWNRWTEFNELWQEARSQQPLPSGFSSDWSEKTRWPPWLICGKNGALYSGARYVALWAPCFSISFGTCKCSITYETNLFPKLVVIYLTLSLKQFLVHSGICLTVQYDLALNWLLVFDQTFELVICVIKLFKFYRKIQASRYCVVIANKGKYYLPKDTTNCRCIWELIVF